MNGIVMPFMLGVLLAIGSIGISHAAANETQVEVTTSTTAAAVTPTTSTTQTLATTQQPKVIIKDSELCKKCSCDIIKLQLDCGNKSMTTVFTDVEWQTLQNGDVMFETIKLDHNEISAVAALPSYPVKTLYLRFNNINNITNAAFRNLSQLTVLDLSNNKLTFKSLGPQAFKGNYSTENYEPLANLKTLNLASNELHALNNDIFEHLPNLETLILSKNTFNVLDTSTTIAISSLNSLKALDISYMELRELPDTIFHAPVELETLILTGNLFKTIPAALTRATHLKKLILDENPLGNFEKTNVFQSLGELEHLSISYLPDVTKIGPGAFSDLQNLTTLIAANNPGLKQIHRLAFTKNTSNPDIFDYPPLTRLLLHNNNLTTVEHKWIDHWEKITELDLRFNPWTCDCTNSWLIHSLMKQIAKTTPSLTADVVCATPSAWKKKPLLELSDNRDELLCENASHTENSSLILVGILVGVLIGIPLTIGGLIVYRNGCFGLRNRRNPAADRYLYNRASFADEFHI